MAIHIPGIRDRHNKVAGAKRTAVATLSLTAMVDMFTVLTIFLLQNYNTTGQVIEIPKEMEMPQASRTKELKPAAIVMVTEDTIMIDGKRIANTIQVKEQRSWMINNLYTNMALLFQEEEKIARQELRSQLRNVIRSTEKQKAFDIQNYRRVTLQADKRIDFLTIKKIMYTLTEAGAAEINFAVIQNTKTLNEQYESEYEDIDEG